MALHTERGIHHVDVCSGSGMLGVGLQIALGKRLRTVAHVEQESRAAAHLIKRMEDKALDQAPIWDDVKTMSHPEFAGFVRRFDPLLVSSGYPCQPFSTSGKRLGNDDPRHLWPFILDFLRLVRPRYFFLENVAGHLSLGFDQVVRELLETDYDVTAGMFSAAEVGASHERKRLFALAVMVDGDRSPKDADGSRKNVRKDCDVGDGTSQHANEPGCNEMQNGRFEKTGVPTSRKPGEKLADARRKRLERSLGAGSPGSWDGSQAHGPAAEFCDILFAPGPCELDKWTELLERDDSLEPAIRRASGGPAAWMDGDRFRLLGNSVVPLVVAYAVTLLSIAHETRE